MFLKIWIFKICLWPKRRENTLPMPRSADSGEMFLLIPFIITVWSWMNYWKYKNHKFFWLIVHNLLIWLKLKLTHLLAKIEQEIVCNHRAYKSKNECCNVCVFVQECKREWNLSHKALSWVLDRGWTVTDVTEPRAGQENDRGKELNACLYVEKVEVPIRIRKGEHFLFICLVKNLEQVRKPCWVLHVLKFVFQIPSRGVVVITLHSWV